MAIYFATVLPGLEFVLEDELRVKFPDTKTVKSCRGKVYFRSSSSSDMFKNLRSAKNLYQYIHRFQVGPHKVHLADIEKEISKLDLAWALNGYPGIPGCKVNASRIGKHTYSRFEAADAALRGIMKSNNCYPKAADEKDHDVEFRLDIMHDEAVFALRLTDAAFRYRTESKTFTRAALCPTVAHALVWLSQPRQNDCFADPFCGSGTILAERSVYPYTRLYGGDIDLETTEAAGYNAGKLNNLIITRWDARAIPLGSGSVDKVVSNLPFGEQILEREDIYTLYAEFLKQLKRIVKPDGIAVLMTDKEHELLQAAGELQLRAYVLSEISLKGLHPKIVKIEFDCP